MPLDMVLQDPLQTVTLPSLFMVLNVPLPGKNGALDIFYADLKLVSHEGFKKPASSISNKACCYFIGCIALVWQDFLC